MIVDSSVVVAICLGEAGHRSHVEKLARGRSNKMSVANWLEVAIVLERKADPRGLALFETILEQSGIDLVPVTGSQAILARHAYRRFGKGNHPARLNFGDCFAYALAKETGEALLFVGDDFAQTDIAAA